jgi:hypothetical protein
MRHTYPSWLTRPLAALGLLLATAGAAQAQTPAATFASATTYGTGGSQPYSIAVADVNGDGKPDLLTPNYGNSTVGVLLGNGNGTFQTATTYSTGGSQPTSLAVADVNGDGKPDLLVANYGSNTAGVLLGNGNGTFQAAATYGAGGLSPDGIAVADVNSDGKPDLLTANYNSLTAGVLLGNGNGTFRNATTYGTGGYPYSLAVADVNGDGKPDLLTANYYASTSNQGASVLLGNGNGTFQTATTYGVGGFTPYSLAVADVSGDGKPDLLTALANGKTGVLLGNGNGTFQIAATYGTASSVALGIAVGDVNGDGKPDLATAKANGTTGVLLGNGNGTFQAATTYSTGSSNLNGVAVADVNGDGKPDLLTANYGNNTAGILLNTSAFTPILTSLSLTSVMEGMSVTITGQNLAGATDVEFNGMPATVFSIVNSTTITATVPAGATTGHVNVTTPSGTSNGLAFTVMTTAPALTDPAPGSTTGGLPAFNGTAPAGSTVTIYLAAGSSAAQAIGTTTTGAGAFHFVPGTALGTGTYSAYATAQVSGQAVSAPSSTTTFTVDATSPTATLSAIANSSAPFAEFSVLFSEPVMNFSLTSVSVSSGLLSLNSGSGSGPYILSVSPTASGPLTVSVLAGAARDAVGNPSLASNSVTVQYVLTTITPRLAGPDGATTGSRPTFSGVAATGSTVTVYAALGSGPAQAIGTTVADANALFSFTPTTALADGNYTSYVTAQLSGQAVSANSNSTTFVVNGAALTATLTSPNTFSGGTIGVLPLAFTATFSQPVTGFTANGINVSNGYVNSGPTGSGTTYTFTVLPSTAGPTIVTLNAGAAQNVAGSPSLSSGPYSLTYGRSLPPLLSLLSPADGSVTNGTPFVGGRASTNSFVLITIVDVNTGLSYSRSTAARGIGYSTQFALPSGVYRATAQAGLNGFTETSNTNTFTVDDTPPTATISTTAGSSTSTLPIPVTVSFSEAVQGFSASSVIITNGTITSAITNVGNDYSFSVTPLTGGVVTVSVPAGAVRDVVANQNPASSPLSVTYVAPVTLTSWTGAVSNDWFTAGNWTAGVPTATLDAVLPAGTRYTAFLTGGTATTQNFTINSGASLLMNEGTLDVRANFTNNGTFFPSGGTVVLGTTAASNGPNILGSARTRFWNLTINANGVLLSTGAGASVRSVLTLNGAFVTQSNPFVLESSATGTALVVNASAAGFVFGTATVQRAIDPSVNPGLGYRHYSAPVSNSTVADLTTAGFTPIVNPAYNTAPAPASVNPYPTVFGYDDARLATTATSNNLSSFDKGYFSPNALADPLTPGRGYTVNISASELVDFQGTLNNGDLPLSLTSTRNTYPDGGWQLLGNPYPAPLDYARVAAADRQGLEGAIYVYSSTSQYTGRYRTYVNGIGNPVLPVGQGFFARVASGASTATMTFRNSQRLTAPDGTTFQRTAASADPRPLVQLELRSATSLTVADEFFAYAEAGATPAFDAAFDAEKLPNPTGFNLASAAPSGEPLAVDGRAAFTATTVLPLSVGVPAAGTYTLSAAALTNLPAGLDAYLADDLTGQTLKLSQGTSYSFSASQAAAPIVGRFRLLFRPATALATTASLSAADVTVFPNPAHARFTVVLPGLGQASTVQAELLNALGQVVRSQTAALPTSGTQLAFDTAELATGVYILRLQAGPATLAKRVVID